MRIRTIKPDFFKHDKISDLKPLTRLLFISLWCIADRRGRLEDRPKRIKVECLPYDECDVDALLWELHSAGFLDRYEVDGVQVIEISSFEKHQRISGKEAESESDYPEKHSGSIREAPSVFPESQERKGRERKGIGKEGNGASAVDCLSIYESYPKKAERPEALKEISVALKIIAHAGDRSDSPRFPGGDRVYLMADLLSCLWSGGLRMHLPHRAFVVLSGPRKRGWLGRGQEPTLKTSEAFSCSRFAKRAESTGPQLQRPTTQPNSNAAQTRQ